MDISQVIKSSTSSPESQQVLQSLPRHQAWGANLCLYKGSWLHPATFHGTWFSQKHFHARDDDILLVTIPKSGTVWLKSLVFAISNRTQYPVSDPNHPILTNNSHVLVPFLEFIYQETENPDFSSLPTPRLFSTHNALDLLPESIKASNTRIIYLYRDQKDILVSTWHFFNKMSPQGNTEDGGKPSPVEEVFKKYCEGITPCGPSWDHLWGYWNASLENPQKILFLKYEDLKEDIYSQVMKIAEFLGIPFSPKEEEEGVVMDIARMCSFEIQSSLEVNKSDGGKRFAPNIENKLFFRKGQIGDWVNYMTPSMAEELDQIMKEKLKGCGLNFS